MIPKYLSAMWPAVAPALGNHLWQSTLFAIVTGLLTLLLRKNQARVRYWLWLAASVKFLVPFSLLIGIGKPHCCKKGWKHMDQTRKSCRGSGRRNRRHRSLGKSLADLLHRKIQSSFCSCKPA